MPLSSKQERASQKFGQVIEGEDYVEKDIFDEMTESQLKRVMC